MSWVCFEDNPSIEPEHLPIVVDSSFSFSLSEAAKSDTENGIIKYAFDWGDGTNVDFFEKYLNIPHSYTSVDSYTIQAWAFDNSNHRVTSDTLCFTFKVVPKYSLPISPILYENVAKDNYLFSIEPTDNIKAILYIRSIENKKWDSMEVRGPLPLDQRYCSLAGIEYFLKLKKDNTLYCNLPYDAKEDSPAYLSVKYNKYINKELEFEENEFEMISIPGELKNKNVFSVLDPIFDKAKYGIYDWLVFAWDAEKQKYSQLSQDDEFNFEAGKAYWINTMSAKNDEALSESSHNEYLIASSSIRLSLFVSPRICLILLFMFSLTK